MKKKHHQIIDFPHLCDGGGDLNKTWYVEYGLLNPNTGKMERSRIYRDLNKGTAQRRRGIAKRIIENIREQWMNGEFPFQENQVAYEDLLLYEKVRQRWGMTRDSVICVHTYLSEFLAVKKTEITAHSFQTYRSKLRIFAEWCDETGLGKKVVAFIEQQHICDFMRYMVTHNNSSRRTIEKYKQLLHTFFDYLLHVKKCISINPVHDIPRMGEVKDEAARPIPDKERSVLMSYMAEHDPQLWLVCAMEYYCAIRPNELRLLRIQDIDLDRNVIRVPQTISKNRKTECVSIPRQLSEYLSLMEIYKHEPNDYLFSVGDEPGKKLLGKNNMRFRFDRIRNKLGLNPRYKLYSFKHTGAVKLVEIGVDVWELQRHFRHQSIATTEQYLRRRFSESGSKIKDRFPDL